MVGFWGDDHEVYWGKEVCGLEGMRGPRQCVVEERNVVVWELTLKKTKNWMALPDTC